MYPVLMGADILIFNAHKVPVGRDQIQHIEMARDMAASFNHLYGEHFTLPEAAIDEHVATLPGLDGRKMSKSYDNTIPLFSSREQLKKLIGGILTDSRAPGEPKDVEGSALFQIYQAFATPKKPRRCASNTPKGIAWGDAKQLLFERIDRDVAPMRERYDDLMAHPEKIEQTILLAGAERARQIATPFVRSLRSAVGLRAWHRPCEAPRPPKRPRPPCPASSNTAKPTASSTSSSWQQMAACCCKARALPHPRTQAKGVSRYPSPGCTVAATEPIPSNPNDVSHVRTHIPDFFSSGLGRARHHGPCCRNRNLGFWRHRRAHNAGNRSQSHRRRYRESALPRHTGGWKRI
jgi:hypothetical protein